MENLNNLDDLDNLEPDNLQKPPPNKPILITIATITIIALTFFAGIIYLKTGVSIRMWT